MKNMDQNGNQRYYAYKSEQSLFGTVMAMVDNIQHVQVGVQSCSSGFFTYPP